MKNNPYATGIVEAFADNVIGWDEGIRLKPTNVNARKDSAGRTILISERILRERLVKLVDVEDESMLQLVVVAAVFIVMLLLWSKLIMLIRLSLLLLVAIWVSNSVELGVISGMTKSLF